MRKIRVSPETLGVLEKFAVRPTAWQYGYELSRKTGLKSGTLYPILIRLERYGLMEARWVTTEEGVPPRHTYRLTPNGVEFARARLAQTSPAPSLREPALNER
jgi:PadR family transcriptional regulator PadR